MTIISKTRKELFIQRLRQVYFSKTLLWALVCIGIVLHFSEYLYNRSLWVDEAGVAMSILEKFKGIIAFFTSFSNLLIVIVAITSLVIVVLSVMQSVNLRKHEFGILKVIGWKPSEIKKLVITETVVLSLISTIAGIALSCVITLLFG